MMRQASRRADVGVLIVLALVVGVVPIAMVGIGTPTLEWPDSGLLFRTIVYPLLVGVLATLFGAPLASWMRSGRAWIALMPLLVPSYLAYVGWGVLRAPDLPTGVWLADAGIQRPAGIALAVFGLSLWAAPLAAIAQAALREREAVRDHLRLDAGFRTRVLTVARLRWRAFATSVLLVSLVMLGSSVPFHLAQVDTWAIRLWFRTQEEPLANVIADAWVLAPPVGLASIRLAMRARRPIEVDVTSVTPSRVGWMVLVLGVVVPGGLLATMLHDGSAMVRFWRVGGEAVLTSAVVSGVVAVLATIVAWASWSACARGSRSLVVPLSVLTFTGLMPGIITGAVLASISIHLPLWMEHVPVVGAHLARFSFVAALGGCWLAHLEDHEMRDQRRLDGGRLPSSWRALVAIGMVPGLLAFHEIEAQVFVLPPGMANFAMWMLQKLHYLRDDEMASGALWTLGLAIVMVVSMRTLWRFGCNIRASSRTR